METQLRQKLLDYIVTSMGDEDFTQEDLFNYETIIEKHKDQLPTNFDNDLDILGLDKSKIVGGITKDKYSQLGVFYMGDNRATTLLWCSESDNRKWDRYKERLSTIDDNDNINKYSYSHNELWIVYIQKNIDTMTVEEMAYAFTMCISNRLILSKYNELDDNIIEEFTGTLSSYKIDNGPMIDIAIKRKEYLSRHIGNTEVETPN